MGRPFLIELATRAGDDLARIAGWYADQSQDGAQRFLSAFGDAARILAAFPRAGRERSELPGNLRSYVVHPYVISHRVDDTARKVTIVRVLHGHLDVDADEFEE